MSRPKVLPKSIKLFNLVKGALKQANRYSPTYDIQIKLYSDLLASRDIYLEAVRYPSSKLDEAMKSEAPQEEIEERIGFLMVNLKLPQTELVKISKECFLIGKSLGFTPDSSSMINKREVGVPTSLEEGDGGFDMMTR